MSKFVSIMALGAAMVVAGNMSAWTDSLEVQEMLQKMQKRIDELEGEVSHLKEGATERGEGGSTAVSALISRVETLEGGLSGLNGFQFGGLMYGSYNYNFNSPESRHNTGRIFDVNRNKFTMDLLQLEVSEVSKETESGIGFRSVLDYGKTAGLIQSDWDGDLAHNFEIQQAYLTYTFGVGNALDMKFGKLATLLGGEVIESPYNPNIWRSFMFCFAIPFTHTGVLVSYALSDMVSLTAGAVNGWDHVVDNNNGKSFFGSVGIEHGDFAWTVNGVFGPEEDHSGKSKTGVFDTVIKYSTVDNIDLLVNFDYRQATNLLAGAGGDADAEWMGLSGIVTLGGGLLNPAWEDWSLALRGESLSDQDGFRTGLARDLWEVTSTLKWQMSEHLQARLEYRHDESNHGDFEKDSRFKKCQDAIILQFAYLKNG